MPKLNIIYSLKKNIEESFFKLLPKDYVGLLEGMIIGDTSYISDKIQNDFKNCGITHLLAVSGSNIAYVLILCKFLFEKIFGRNISNVLSICFIFIFMILSGASASVVRAVIMAISIIVAELLSQKPNTFASLAFSAIIILMYNPLIICDVGFILSYTGTIGILLFSEKINKYLNYKLINLGCNSLKEIFVETLSVTLSAQMIVAPIILYYFNTFSVVSIIVNMMVVPITGFITIIGIIMYVASILFMPLAKIISYGVYFLISIIIFISNFFSKIPYSNILLPTPSIVIISLYYFIITYVYNKKSWNEYKYIKTVIFLIIFILIGYQLLPYNHIKVNMIDVGQGDCIFIETEHKKKILIDTGGSENSDYDVGEKIVVPYLLDRGKTDIDYIFISHFHEDHAEGILSIIDQLNVSKVIINRQTTETDLYLNLISKIDKSKIIIIDENDKIEIDGVTFNILLSNEEMDNLNNTSVIMKMIYGECSILFTGDAESELEYLAKNNVKSQILKVAHHGSNTSTTDDFLDKVSPKIALISVGKNNKFGHPKKEIIEKLQNRNIQIYRTDINGEIMMKLYKNGEIIINMYNISQK